METIEQQLEWYKRYSYYIYRAYLTIDAEASGYADGDEEYEENFN